MATISFRSSGYFYLSQCKISSVLLSAWPTSWHAINHRHEFEEDSSMYTRSLAHIRFLSLALLFLSLFFVFFWIVRISKGTKIVNSDLMQSERWMIAFLFSIRVRFIFSQQQIVIKKVVSIFFSFPTQILIVSIWFFANLCCGCELIRFQIKHCVFMRCCFAHWHLC